MLNIAEMHQTQMYVYFRVVQLPRRDGTTLLPYFRLNCMSTLFPDNSAQKRSWFFFNQVQWSSIITRPIAIWNCVKRKNKHGKKIRLCTHKNRDQSRYGLSQWEMTLHCNVISYWLSPHTEWSLQKDTQYLTLTGELWGIYCEHFGEIIGRVTRRLH